MNKRIKELMELADKFAKENKVQTITGPGNNYFEIFQEKFAELIVQRCMLKCNEAAQRYRIMADSDRVTPAGRAIYEGFWGGAKACSAIISENFGVEE